MKENKNFLNWYPFKSNSNILEFGADNLETTKILLDKANLVTSVVFTDEIEKEYHTKLKNKNLEIILSRFNEIILNKKFDYIILFDIKYPLNINDSFIIFSAKLLSQRRLVKAVCGKADGEGLIGHKTSCDIAGVNAAREGEQYLLFADLLTNGSYLLVDKCSSKLRCGNTFHSFRSFVRIHDNLSSI